MLIPYGTDAPIYHWPKVTVGLIVVNVLAFLATAGMDFDNRMAYAMRQGDGLHPVEWLTSMFMHGNVSHLVGNMIFLWAFGIVVEGKLGPWKFLAVYLAIGVFESALTQVITLKVDDPRPILGASAAIYGLLAVCLVWAPSNELNCFYFWRFFPHQVDIAILWFALLYIGLEFAVVVWTKGEVRTEFLHFTGAAVGFAVGVAILKADLVDCENWDLFAVMQGRTGLSKDALRARKTTTAAARPVKDKKKSQQAKANASGAPAEDPSVVASRRLRKWLDAADPVAAHGAYDKALRTVPGWQPTGPEWKELIKLLLDAREFRSAVGAMEDYLRRDSEASPRVRLKLAQVLVRDQNRPAHALRVLDAAPAGSIAGSLQTSRDQIAAEAHKLIDEGVMEIDGDHW